jgi:hypothetical protein
MKVSDLVKLINEEVALRAPNQAKIDEYAERMENGVKFPSVTIGTWPKSDKYGSEGIVDGLHRVAAAKQAKIESLDATTVSFPSIQDALTYMYTANMAHGLPPTEGQRNARIVLIKKIDPTLTLEKIASQFKLGKSSIDRILKGQQREGRGGVQTGSKRSAAHKSLEPMKPKAFFTALERINYTLERVRATAEIVAAVTPESEEGVNVDTDKRDAIQGTIKFLNSLVKAIADSR